MIAYLKGKIKYRGSNYIILDVNDVGYKIFVSSAASYPSADEAGKLQATSSIWIFHHIKEDKNELYGFNTQEELNFFELLLKVNGVGPKMASNILSKTNVNKLKQAISQGDVKLLTAVGGVGKKIAGKIIVELKNKLSTDDKIDFSDQSTEEVLDALKQLGYKEQEIILYLSRIPAKFKTSSEKVKWVLKTINK